MARYALWLVAARDAAGLKDYKFFVIKHGETRRLVRLTSSAVKQAVIFPIIVLPSQTGARV